jgi:predicted nucleic-acid-binding Zn-ribbon protein
MAGSKQCPKCSSAMIEGFTMDQTHGAARVAKWVEGEPRRSIWTGLKLRGANAIEIGSWRCRRCGFLESYAPD